MSCALDVYDETADHKLKNKDKNQFISILSITPAP